MPGYLPGALGRRRMVRISPVGVGIETSCWSMVSIASAFLPKLYLRKDELGE